jgi:hypothetical protein
VAAFFRFEPSAQCRLLPLNGLGDLTADVRYRGAKQTSQAANPSSEIARNGRDPREEPGGATTPAISDGDAAMTSRHEGRDRQITLRFT